MSIRRNDRALPWQAALVALATGGILAATAMARQAPDAPTKTPVVLRDAARDVAPDGSRGVSRGAPVDLGFSGREGHTPDLSDLSPRVRDMQARAVERGTPQSAGGWANRALSLVAAGNYMEASDAFARSADLYEERGDSNTSIVMRTQSDRYRSDLRLYYHRTPQMESVRRYDTGRRLEPIYGTYVGAFIDREDGVVGTYVDGNRFLKDCGEFDKKIGANHALFFTYNGYGSGVPNGWFAHLKLNDAGAQWVIEPDDLNDVQDDERLHTLAEAARDAGIPIWVRFASEMNGNWTPYHAPAALYREKFRLVAKVFHQVAPNVAMVWCPNNLPQASIPDYYPGEDAVDWVGVNFYAPYFNNNDPRRVVSWRNPADNLDWIYRRYAAKHPIMVGEWAATHRGQADGVTRNDFAVNKIGQFYAAIPRMYPRVKAINWFDMNTIQYAGAPSRRINDYSLLSEPPVANQYREMVASPYFLGEASLGKRAVAREEIVPLADGTPLRGTVTLSALARTYEDRPEVTYLVAGKPFKTFTVPGTYAVALDTTALPNGRTPITVVMRDSKGRITKQVTTTVIIQNGGAAIAAPPVPSPAKSVPTKTASNKPKKTGKKTKLPTVKTTAKPSAVKPAPAKPVQVAKTTPTPPRPAFTEVDTPPTAASQTLADALAGATTDAETLGISRTPPGDKITLADRIRLRMEAGESGFLFITVTRSSGEGKGDEMLLFPRRAAIGGGDVSTARVGANESVSVPSDPNRALVPDAAGDYVFRVYLFTNEASAQAFARGFAGTDSPTADVLGKRRREEKVAVDENRIYVAQDILHIVEGGRGARGVRRGKGGFTVSP